MKIYKHRLFTRWAKTQDICNYQLKNIVKDLQDEIFEGNLGGGLYKKRLAPTKSKRGKRSGYRYIIAFKKNDRAFFIYGYAKNKLANISNIEKSIYKKLAKYLLNADQKVIDKMIEDKSLIEVN